jgi:hypothetical protein
VFFETLTENDDDVGDVPPAELLARKQSLLGVEFAQPVAALQKSDRAALQIERDNLQALVNLYTQKQFRQEALARGTSDSSARDQAVLEVEKWREQARRAAAELEEIEKLLLGVGEVPTNGVYE